jgi:hypothetical protein
VPIWRGDGYARETVVSDSLPASELVKNPDTLAISLFRQLAESRDLNLAPNASSRFRHSPG